MQVRSRVTKDNRTGSRVIARLNCRMEYREKECDAVIVDLSSKSALLSSPCLPAVDDEVKIRLRTKHLDRELVLTGRVLRGTDAMTDHGKRGRFVVRFHESPLDLLVLIRKLIAAA